LVSGANVFTTLSAGTIGFFSDWDSGLASLLPPTAPASIVPDLLTQVATARAQVISDKNDSYSEFVALLGDMATAQSDAGGDIATAYSDVVSQTATALSDSATALSNAQSEAVSQFGVTQADLDRAAARAGSVGSSESSFDATLATQATARATARENAERDAATLALKIATSRTDITLDKAKAADEFSDKLDQERDWAGKWDERFMSVLNALSDPMTPIHLVRAQIENIQQQWGQMEQLADTAEMTGVRRYYMIVGAIVADMVGLRQLVGAFDGADPYTLQKWSTAERILNGALGGFQLVTTAVGISAFISRMTTACGSYRWGSCFTADMRPEYPPEMRTRVVDVTTSPPLDVEGKVSWFGKAFVVAITGMGGTYLFVHRHQERRRRRPMHQTIDDLFAGGLLDRLLIPTT
jgi:hypothetical protein